MTPCRTCMDEKRTVRMVTVWDDIAGKRDAKFSASEIDTKVDMWVWMWGMDGLRSADGRVGAAAVCTHRECWRPFHCHLGTGPMEVYNAALWAIGLTLW